MTRKPRILFFDIESAGVNALYADLGFVIVFGYKWLDEKKAHALLIDEESLKSFNDKKILTQASKLLMEADLIVGHFASVFDRRFINGRLLINGLEPLPATKLRDTCMIARSVAKFSTNRLKHLAEILDLRHKKQESGWPGAWFKVMRGNLNALRGLGEYCKGDVLVLEDLYLKLRPFDNPHPRMFTDKEKCGACGGEVTKWGFAYVGQNKYQRVVCKSCGRWDRKHKTIN
jgi:uncharacterized protein YprB with RNaseH-like and TPR domain